MSIITTHIPELTDQQNSVYLAALELGPDTIQHIAKKAKLPRSTTYLIIDELKSKGLVSQTKRENKTLIVAEPPTRLLELAQQALVSSHESMKKIQEALPQLRAIHNTRENKPLVRFYEGFEGIKTILENSLEAQEILVLCSGYQKPMDKQLENYIFENHLPATNKRGIKTREIITRDPDWKKYVDKYASKDHQIKVSSQTPMENHIDKLIYADTVAILAYDALNGTVIEHPHISEYEKSLFNQLWNTLK